MSVAVSLDQLVVDFGDDKKKMEALKGLSATIPEGRITGLMGPDASGKTTLMRVIAGLIPPTGGRVKIFGHSPSALLASQPNSIGYMPQRFGLYEDLTIMANLELYASLRGVTGEERDRLFRTLLGFTSLGPFTSRLAGDLSGGMKQKLGIACALLGKPRLLLLDEPGVGVDPRSRRELWDMVQELSSGGMSVLWSTSYLDEAALCPGLIMLQEGSILYEGKPEELTKRATGLVYLLDVGANSEEQDAVPRQALTYWIQREGILDALIQGKYARLVVKPDAPPDLLKELHDKGAVQTGPRLEDAYMMEVGGIDKRPSPYSRVGRISEKNSGPIILANRLTKKFGSFTAANNITFQVSPGEIMGLLGPNGAGKSTTFRMLCGLLRPTSGDCFVAGADLLRSSSNAREHLGYMAQKFSLYQDISVWGNIRIFADLYGLDRRRREEILPLLTDALDLEPWVNRKSGELPLGLKQRLALLCATLHKPPAIFLDEPTSGVDVRGRRDFWKHIAALTAAGAAVLVTTHFMEEAEYCDRIALIYRGNMIRLGSPEELKATVKGKANPTMEDAFIANINEYDKEHPL